MEHIYRCDWCKREFDSEAKCSEHEEKCTSAVRRYIVTWVYNDNEDEPRLKLTTYLRRQNPYIDEDYLDQIELYMDDASTLTAELITQDLDLSHKDTYLKKLLNTLSGGLSEAINDFSKRRQLVGEALCDTSKIINEEVE